MLLLVYSIKLDISANELKHKPISKEISICSYFRYLNTVNVVDFEHQNSKTHHVYDLLPYSQEVGFGRGSRELGYLI